MNDKLLRPLQELKRETEAALDEISQVLGSRGPLFEVLFAKILIRRTIKKYHGHKALREADSLLALDDFWSDDA